MRGRRDIAEPSVVERYIRGGVMPRFMQRLRDIDAGLARHQRLLGHLYADVRRTHRHDTAAFAGRSFRRERPGPEWILERFPPRPAW